jgi:uncharacterized paraquat-inducible protein A
MFTRTGRDSGSAACESVDRLRALPGDGLRSHAHVFLIAVLVALVKLQQLATIRTGLALPAFAAPVVLTILASGRLDPALIWPDAEPAERRVHTP